MRELAACVTHITMIHMQNTEEMLDHLAVCHKLTPIKMMHIYLRPVAPHWYSSVLSGHSKKTPLQNLEESRHVPSRHGCWPTGQDAATKLLKQEERVSKSSKFKGNIWDLGVLCWQQWFSPTETAWSKYLRQWITSLYTADTGTWINSYTHQYKLVARYIPSSHRSYLHIQTGGAPSHFPLAWQVRVADPWITYGR